MSRQIVHIRGIAVLALAAIISACTDFALIKHFEPSVPLAPVAVDVPKVVELTPPVPWGVAKLLLQADMAFKRGRYTTPEEDNAFDRYKAVLVLDPGNGEAIAGLDSVQMAYVDYVRAVKISGNLPQAQDLAARGETYFPNSPLLKQLKQELKRANPPSRSDDKRKGGSFALDGNRVLLPEQPLSKKSADVKSMLAALAKRVRNSDESILIVARNDREGRWIYQAMQEVVSGYRIRGDIHIGRTPAIEFMPPL